MSFFGPGGPHFDPFFTIFCKSLLNVPLNIISKNKKKIHSLEKFLSPKKCENGHKRTKNGCFFGPRGPNFDPFFTIFCKSLLNMALNIILKNQENSVNRKNFKSEKVRKWQKKGQKWLFLALEGRILTLFSQFFANHF